MPLSVKRKFTATKTAINIIIKNIIKKNTKKKDKAIAGNEIKLFLTVDGKQAIATINNTDDMVKQLYQSFKYGNQEVNGLTTAISQGFRL